MGWGEIDWVWRSGGADARNGVGGAGFRLRTEMRVVSNYFLQLIAESFLISRTDKKCACPAEWPACGPSWCEQKRLTVLGWMVAS